MKTDENDTSPKTAKVRAGGLATIREITFIVTEDTADGGYYAHAHWPKGNRDIITEGDDRDDLIQNIREALDVTFEDDKPGKPELVHLHFVRDEVISL